jgi:glycyl-tRNA synthetase beta chain
MDKQDLLLEIGCEELPTLAVKSLSAELQSRLCGLLNQHQLAHGAVQVFATPRRVGIFIADVDAEQSAQTIERQGPAMAQAYNANGQPTPAALGFAKSCGVTVEALREKDQRLYYKGEKPGQKTIDLLADLVKQTISQMTVAKPMRWGSHPETFARPVHWILLLFGGQTIKTTLFGVESGNQTFGHRFHHPAALTVKHPKDYPNILRDQGKVIADFDERLQKIRQAIHDATPQGHQVETDEELLNEVTALVEWPVALVGHFNPEFLQVPQEALITSMKINQKYFPVLDKQGRLQSAFVLISNIVSTDPALIIHGNERVINARLTDAAFFFKNDLEHSLESQLPHLEHVTFQKQLGSLAHKTERMVKTAAFIAEKIGADIAAAKQAAQLAKCDLLSEMVNEFPTLQGAMGYYYARNDGLSESCARAIKEHYLPRYFRDQIPTTKEGYAVALADKLDTLVGIFGINQAPTGDKDPFALRRAANGILQMLIAKESSPLSREELLRLDLMELLQQARQAYTQHLPNADVIQQVFDFTQVRLKSILMETHTVPEPVTVEQFESVRALNIARPLDFVLRLDAVREFQKLPAAAALAAANKRVSNILKKQAAGFASTTVNEALFEHPEERELARTLTAQTQNVAQAVRGMHYTPALTQLAHLKSPIDAFFDKVMVMTDDPAKRANRLALLTKLHHLLTQVADISFLSL